MKKIMLISFIVFLLMLLPAKAGNLGIKVEPAESWIGDDVRIYCFYDENPLDKTPQAYIERTSWSKILTRFNNTFFECTYTPPLLGTYQVFCSDGAANSSKESFKVIDLDLSITDYPSKVYLDHEMVLHAELVEKGDLDRVITRGINSKDFNVYLNSEKILVNIDKTYPDYEEWIVTTKNVSSSFILGSYTLTLKVTYKGKTFSASKQVEIKPPLEFELINVDKTWVKPNDNITFTFKTLYEGNSFEFRKEYLRIWIDSHDVSISDIYQSGSYSDVTVSVPNLNPGSYDLKIRFSYMDFVGQITKDIYYVIKASGEMRDSEDKPIHVELNFENDEIQKTLVTDSKGSYSGEIPPGDYNLELNFPNSKLILYDIEIDEFDDPIRFNYLSGDVGIPGIGIGGVFIYEIDLPYSDVYLQMEYDDSKILDESEIVVYKCKNWNFGRKICNSEWYKVIADIDTIKNIVEMNNTELSAFVIGYKKNFNLDFGANKEEYYINDIIRVMGIIEDDDKKAVPDVKITASIPNTHISASTNSDNGGVFSLEFQGPDKEGSYSIIVRAEKSPFLSVESSKNIRVYKSRQVTIILSESIKIKKGEEDSIPVDIVNTGQIDLSSLKLYLTGIPEEYYTLSESEISSLKAGNDERIFINFNIPDDASGTTYTGNFKVTYNGNSTEQNFILTLLAGEKKEENATSSEGFKFPSIIIPTGEVILGGITGDVLLIIIVGIVSFSIAVFLKTRKFTIGLPRKTEIKIEERHEREDIKNLLLDIRREIERPSIKKTPSIKFKKKRKYKKKKTKQKRKKKKHVPIGS